MSQVIKISNGEVTLKGFCSRGLKKKISAALYSGMDVDGEGKANGTITPESLEKSNDVAVLGMIEKMVMGEKEIKPTTELLDAIDSNDFNLILGAIDKITTKEPPKA